MPLFKLPGDVAFANRKTNEFSGWSNRNQANRVEPIATPGFDTAFQLERGEKIFTIGSCFARNVELELRKRGFEVPVRDLFETGEFKNYNPAIVNNFGVPSINNEFRWALDPDFDYDFDANIVETTSDKFVDLHVIPSEKPAPRDEVVHRRQAIIDVHKTVVDCRVVVMTLGLIELWFDTEQNIYLNAAPNPRVFKNQPERFELHVLDYSDCYETMKATMRLLNDKCRDDQQILLTVSPVPLMTTLRSGIDVMVANTYSKSCLRTVAESIVAEFDNVHYYPSYESVTLSDRKLAWKDDMTHVTDEIVKLNVGRMIQAYCPPSEEENALDAAIKAGGPLVAIEHARNMVDEEQAVAISFFERYEDIARQNAEFAAEAVSVFAKWRAVEKARTYLGFIPEDWNPLKQALLESRLLEQEGNHERIIEILAPHRERAGKLANYWRLLLSAYARTGKVREAKTAMLNWTEQSANAAYQALTIMGIGFINTVPEEAVAAFERAFEVSEPKWVHVLNYAEALIRADQTDQARKVLDKFVPEDGAQQRRKDRVMLAL